MGGIRLMLIEDPVDVLGCIYRRVELVFCQILSRFWEDADERTLSESFPWLYSPPLDHNCSIASMVRFSSMQ